jgi:hypothetical protein
VTVEVTGRGCGLGAVYGGEEGEGVSAYGWVGGRGPEPR